MFDRSTLILAGLVAATIFGFGIGTTESARPALAAILVLAITSLKAIAVIREYMEVREAPALLRFTAGLWPLAVFVLLSGIVLAR